MILRIFFKENDNFVRETKIVPQEENTVNMKEAQRKVTILQIRGNHVGKRRQNAKFRTFYWKLGVKQILSGPTKVSEIIELFSETTSEILCKKTSLYYFQNQGKYASSSKELNGWMSVWQNWGKKKLQ
jgi:hypothetical protein